MKQTRRLFHIVLFALFTQGCGTVASHYGSSWPGDSPSDSTGTYRGVKGDINELVSTDFYPNPGYPALWDVLVACDLPFSAVADTFALPFDRASKENTNQQTTASTP